MSKETQPDWLPPKTGWAAKDILVTKKREIVRTPSLSAPVILLIKLVGFCGSR
jgi:hypothetical protein